MPELPEVQTIVTDLQALTSDTITGFWSDFKKAIQTTSFEKKIIGKKILSVQRLGKNIILKLSSGDFILIHLKMTGRLLLSKKVSVADNQKEYGRHAHHIFLLQKNKSLVFHDVRKFGTISLLNEKKVAEIKNLCGIDPINDSFPVSDLELILEKRKNKPIKSVLMDNSVILGIGNIYASEILFDSHILPTRQAKSLSKKEASTLHASIKKILAKAIQLRGTSVSDYRDSWGQKGTFQNELKVYKKHGQKCKDCDTIIEKVIIGQRSTFFCPKCQR